LLSNRPADPLFLIGKIPTEKRGMGTNDQQRKLKKKSYKFQPTAKYTGFFFPYSESLKCADIAGRLSSSKAKLPP
jgi:hypothetical protein